MSSILATYHLLLFGNILGNIAIVIGFINFVRKKYLKRKHLINQFIDEHDEMYKEYCKRTNKEISPVRLQLI